MFPRPKEPFKWSSKDKEFEECQEAGICPNIAFGTQTVEALLVCVWSYAQIINSTLKPKSVAEIEYSKRTGMQMRKLRCEIFLGLALLCVSVSSIIWVYSMVYAASEVGTMERKDMKQWSLVLVLLSVTTLFIGSVGGYLIGKYLHVPHRQPESSVINSQNESAEVRPQSWCSLFPDRETAYSNRRYVNPKSLP